MLEHKCARKRYRSERFTPYLEAESIAKERVIYDDSRAFELNACFGVCRPHRKLPHQPSQELERVLFQ